MTSSIALAKNIRRADHVRTEWKVVTPDMATRWLEGNTHNRPVRDAVVARYASDMKAGRWRQSHQGIAFDEEGVLIDGQHRLFAVIEANTEVIMQVTFGLPIDTQLVVDDGVKRTLVDIMRVNNTATEGMTGLHAAVAERVRKGLMIHPATVTRQEAGLFVQRHWEAINFAVSRFPPAKRVKGITSAGPLAAIARAYYHEKMVDLERFCEVLATGMSDGQRDMAIIKLRNWLMTRKNAGGASPQMEAYAKTERAIKSFVKGESVGRNLIAVAEDLYPLPKR